MKQKEMEKMIFDLPYEPGNKALIDSAKVTLIFQYPLRLLFGHLAGTYRSVGRGSLPYIKLPLVGSTYF